jgi:hypothetical protein
MRYRITCTTKLEKHEHVVDLGCYSTDNSYFRFTEAEVISRIESGQDTFYTERPNGHVAEVIVFELKGEKFLRTKPDGELPNNLDWLPDCPPKERKVFVPPVRTVTPAASHGTLWWC